MNAGDEITPNCVFIGISCTEFVVADVTAKNRWIFWACLIHLLIGHREEARFLYKRFPEVVKVRWGRRTKKY